MAMSFIHGLMTDMTLSTPFHGFRRLERVAQKTLGSLPDSRSVSRYVKTVLIGT